MLAQEGVVLVRQRVGGGDLEHLPGVGLPNAAQRAGPDIQDRDVTLWCPGQFSKNQGIDNRTGGVQAQFVVILPFEALTREECIPESNLLRKDAGPDGAKSGQVVPRGSVPILSNFSPGMSLRRWTGGFPLRLRTRWA